MNDLTQRNATAISSRFANVKPDNDLAAGIESGFGVINIKGKVWSLVYRGEKKSYMRPNNEGAYNSIDVVIIKSPVVKSKTYYKGQWIEGSTEQPHCFSNNGLVPDPQAREKQSPTCTACPHNQWGSRITPAGKKAKACADNKRIAVVPLADMRNEAFGGPLLLRVPPASLKALADYGDKVASMGVPYYAIATKISFNPSKSHPEFMFGEIRRLKDDEADIVIEFRNSAQVGRILAEGPGVEAEEAHEVEDVSLAPSQKTNHGTTPIGNVSLSPAPNVELKIESPPVASLKPEVQQNIDVTSASAPSSFELSLDEQLSKLL